jgi:hypothetical protein
MYSVSIMLAINYIRTVDSHGAAVQAARALGICFGDASEGSSPFMARIGQILHCNDVVLDAEFALDLAESATEEALTE